MMNQTPFNSREDTAVENIRQAEFICEVHEFAIEGVGLEKRERHVMIWEHFYLLKWCQNTQEPQNMSRGGRKGKSWGVREVR